MIEQKSEKVLFFLFFGKFFTSDRILETNNAYKNFNISQCPFNRVINFRIVLLNHLIIISEANLAFLIKYLLIVLKNIERLFFVYLVTSISMNSKIEKFLQSIFLLSLHCNKIIENIKEYIHFKTNGNWPWKQLLITKLSYRIMAIKKMNLFSNKYLLKIKTKTVQIAFD